jgi:hypothetical protein
MVKKPRKKQQKCPSCLETSISREKLKLCPFCGEPMQKRMTEYITSSPKKVSNRKRRQAQKGSVPLEVARVVR